MLTGWTVLLQDVVWLDTREYFALLGQSVLNYSREKKLGECPNLVLFKMVFILALLFTRAGRRYPRVLPATFNILVAYLRLDERKQRLRLSLVAVVLGGVAMSFEEEELHPNSFEQEEQDYLTIYLNQQRCLRLRQYGSSDDRWGIYSSVWDGGIAMAAYLKQTFTQEDWKKVTVIDLGSGTGIAGLAAASLSKGRAIVHLTDLPQAVPLLTENICLNSNHWSYGPYVHSPAPTKLEWGSLVDRQWLETVVKQARAEKRRHVLIIGADAVYQPSLFVPLLSTISQLHARLKQMDPRLQIRCLLSCQSIRTGLRSFWNVARQSQGLACDLKAVVTLKDDSSRLHLKNATIEMSEDPHTPPDDAPAIPGRILMVELRTLPFTFSV